MAIPRTFQADLGDVPGKFQGCSGHVCSVLTVDIYD
jgi:hypothetical protein